LTAEEAQFGRGKIFIKKPETYFALETLREERISWYVIRIQRAWKRFSSRKHLIALQNGMSRTYAQAGKARR
jgi:myosin I